MTKIIQSLTEWKAIRKKLLENIGFVPTMGNLHAGHLSLLQRSKAENTITVLSLFVNPTQFNNRNDFSNYPRTLENDIKIAIENEIDFILMPNYEMLYPDNYSYKITNTADTSLEAAFRPMHFDGVLTVVMKFLLLVKPTRAYFGEKDYQQLQLVKGLKEAFFLDSEIIGCETIRNAARLPLSSRNHRMTVEQFKLAEYFSTLFHSEASCQEIKEALIEKGIYVDYIEEYRGRRFAAIRIDDIRLIDNFALK